jgi:hypothetical protein
MTRATLGHVRPLADSWVQSDANRVLRTLRSPIVTNIQRGLANNLYCCVYLSTLLGRQILAGTRARS